MALIQGILNWISSLFAPPAPATPEPPGSGGGALPSKIGAREVRAAIKRGIVDPMGWPDRSADILTFQSSRETAKWGAWYFQGPQKDGLAPTYNLFNRRVGSGRGEWTGSVKMIGGDDTRIFKDIDQAARDFRQWLSDPIAVHARAALAQGDGFGYLVALENLGFSARKGDYLAYADQWDRGVVV